MIKITELSAVLFLLPTIVLAQDVQSYLENLLVFVNDVLIPFLLGVGFLLFVYNAIRFFVIEGSNKEGKEKAKALAIYSITAFVLIVVFWGIVNLLSSSFGLDGCTQPGSDYVQHNYTGPILPNCP